MAQVLSLTIAYSALAPSLLLFVGSLKKVIANPQRIARLQVEGAFILTVTIFSRFLIVDYLLLLDQKQGTSFFYWFNRGEQGMFAVGAILFFLGFFLERRPRPNLKPWPHTLALASKLTLIIGLFLAAYIAWKQVEWAFSELSLFRTVLSHSFLVFALSYCILAFERPHEVENAEGDLLGIED